MACRPAPRLGLSRKILRASAITLALVETAVFLLLAYFGLAESDTTFRIASTIAKLAAVPFFFGVLPALVLAVMNRALPLAAALSIGVLLVTVYVWPRL